MVRIITDSAADFEPCELERMNITCVPLSVFFGENEYVENVSLSKAQFYEMLRNEKDFPRTSQPSPESFLKPVLEAKERGDDVVIVTISSGLSGTYQGAVLAKNMSEHSGCYVVDSLTGTGGERLLVEYAVRMRDNGKTAAEIAAALEAVRPRIVLYTCMDTLEYLHRGGRISHTTYAIGSLAHIKPIMHVTKDGRPEIPAKMLGMRKGIDYLCRQIKAVEPDPDFPVYVMFTENRSNGELLARRLGDIGYDIPNERIINVGAAVGTHIGPNACAIVYIGNPEEKEPCA